MDSNSRFSLNGHPKGNSQPSEDERRAKVTQALATRFDELNKRWAAAEAELKKIPLPVDVWVSVEQHTDDESGAFYGETMLGFAQSKGGWRICIAHVSYNCNGPSQEEWTWAPIVESALNWRLKAVPVLPQLRAKILEAAEESVAKLDDVLKTFK